MSTHPIFTACNEVVNPPLAFTPSIVSVHMWFLIKQYWRTLSFRSYLYLRYLGSLCFQILWHVLKATSLHCFLLYCILPLFQLHVFAKYGLDYPSDEFSHASTESALYFTLVKPIVFIKFLILSFIAVMCLYCFFCLAILK